MPKIRVLVADDHPIINVALAAALEPFGIEQVGAVTSAEEVLPCFLATRPDVLILDIRLGAANALDVTRDLLEQHPDARVVFHSQFEQDEMLQAAYRGGAKAFVPKRFPPALLAEAVIAAHEGRTFMLPEIATRLALLGLRGDDSPAARLTAREYRIFKLMAVGKTLAEISKEVDLSAKTCGAIAQDIKAKLHLTTTEDVIRLANKHHLLD